MASLSNLSNEQLLAKNEALMADRAKAEAKFKAAQMEVAAELDRRATMTRLDDVRSTLAGLPEDMRTALLAEMGG